MDARICRLKRRAKGRRAPPLQGHAWHDRHHRAPGREPRGAYRHGGQRAQPTRVGLGGLRRKPPRPRRRHPRTHPALRTRARRRQQHPPARGGAASPREHRLCPVYCGDGAPRRSRPRVGSLRRPREARHVLGNIDDAPCIPVMALLDDPGGVPDPGGVQIGGDPLFWVADNRKKGISRVPAVTIHAGPEFSREHSHSDDATITRLLLEEAKDYVSTGVQATAVYRWEYSQPANPHDEPFVYVEGPPPLMFCGDAYAGPTVEGAVTSGDRKR